MGDVAAQIITGAHCHVLVAGWQARMWSQRILVACDGSEQSDQVADIAALIGRITRTPVTLMTVVGGEKDAPSATADLALKAGRMRVDGVDCNTCVVEGSPEQAIPALASELGADLVVLGRKHGSGGAPDRIIGGLACAVLLVRFGAEARDLDKAFAQQA